MIFSGFHRSNITIWNGFRSGENKFNILRKKN